jgi:hypothetical protein
LWRYCSVRRRATPAFAADDADDRPGLDRGLKRDRRLDAAPAGVLHTVASAGAAKVIVSGAAG